MKDSATSEQKIQSDQYAIPYHYIPSRSEAGFSQVVHWSWGARYLAGLELVLRTVAEEPFDSLLDVGCGDGRFLREVDNRFNPSRLVGVDYSQRAVALAAAMNPELDFRCDDITCFDGADAFDVVTMVEVLEHIPLGEVDAFLDGVAERIAPGGRLVLTVPHRNKLLNPKHFQHFDSGSLTRALENRFDVERMHPFDQRSRTHRVLEILLGGAGRYYIVTNAAINDLVYRRVLNKALTAQHESKSGRLLAVARPR